MRTVPYASVLAAAGILWEGKASPDVRTAAQLNVFLNRRATEYWERFPWPEWCPTERRFFAALWTSTEWDAGQTVYFPPTNAYYQSLANGVSTAPADDDGNTDEANWALLPVNTPEDWQDDLAYELGDQVRHPATLRTFQARIAVGAGLFEPGVAVDWDDYWGEVLPFYRVVPLEQDGQTPIGECFRIYGSDPRLCPNAEGWRPRIIQEGIQSVRSANVVWLHFRERAPSWTGNPWSATATYESALNSQPSTLNQVWDSATGDYYRSLAADNLNHALTAAAFWERIEFPYVLREAVPQAAYADMLRLDGQHEKFPAEAREALRLLQREFDKLERQQGQTARLPVCTRD